jgi:hypothetical protein
MTQEALKLALEALEWCHGGEPCGTAEAIAVVEKALAQPEQEPVIDKSAAIRIATALGWTPPRPWVGLTDEEIDSINYTSAYMLAREVEAKLKERNQ